MHLTGIWVPRGSVGALAGAPAFDGLVGEWLTVGDREFPGMLRITTRRIGVVRAWSAGLAASRGAVAVFCVGPAPPEASFSLHIAAYADPRLGAYLGGDAWSVRRRALDAVGPIDEWFGGGGWFAPSDIAARVAADGWAVRIEGAGLPPPDNARCWEQWTWNAARYARKRGGWRAPIRVARAVGRAAVQAGRMDRFDLLPELVDAATAGWIGG